MKKRNLIRIGLAGALGMIALAGCNLVKEENDDFDPSINQNEDVYGPPIEDFDPSDNINEDVYGPPLEDYDAIDNMEACVYGPPEDMNSEVK